MILSPLTSCRPFPLVVRRVGVVSSGTRAAAAPRTAAAAHTAAASTRTAAAVHTSAGSARTASADYTSAAELSLPGAPHGASSQRRACMHGFLLANEPHMHAADAL